MSRPDKFETERYFKRYIAPHEYELSEALQKARQEVNRRIVPGLCWALGIGGLASVIFFLFNAPVYTWPAFVDDFWKMGVYVAAGVSLVALLIIYFVYINGPMDDYKSELKSKILPLVLKVFGNKFQHSGACPVSVSSLDWSDLVPSHDDESSEDYIQGEYNEVPFQAFETKLTSTSRDSKGHTRTTTKFRGMYLLLDVKTGLQEQIVIKRDKSILNSVYGFFKGKFQGLEKTEIAHPEFEKLFEVYARSPDVAKSFLSGRLLDNLIAYANSSREKLAFSITNNKILVQIETSRNRFEMQQNDQDFLRVSFDAIMDDMDTIFKAIEAFEPVTHNRYV